MENKYNIGLEIFFINIVLVGYILTSGGEKIFNHAISISSSIVAVIINIWCVKKYNKKILNCIFLCLNIIVLVGCITLLILDII